MSFYYQPRMVGDGEEVNESEETPSPETACAFAIVAEQDRLSDTGGKLLKADAREKFGGALGVRSFNRAWEDARRMRPELGEGGRPKRNPDTVKKNPDSL